MSSKSTLLFILVPTLVMLGIFGALRPNAPGVAAKGDVVALSAAPGNVIVQMFDALRDGPDTLVTEFPSRLRCTRVDDKTYKFGSGDTIMFFDKLNCNGTIGFVNEKWIDD